MLRWIKLVDYNRGSSDKKAKSWLFELLFQSFRDKLVANAVSSGIM